MFGHKKPDVLVVGAGPVGLFAALALAKRGVEVEIVDREWRSGTRSYALALHPESLRLLEQAGVVADVMEHAHRVRKIGIDQESERKAELRISDLAEDHSFLAVFCQHDLERVLEKALRAAGVKVHWSHEVTALHQDSEHVTARLNRLAKDSMGYTVQHTEWVISKTYEEKLRFVIGADGHSSQVRRALEIEFPTVADTTDFAVFEFKTDNDLTDEMRIVLNDANTNVFWPLPGGHCRWSFQIPIPANDEDTREKSRNIVMPGEGYEFDLTEQHLRELIAERAPWFHGSIEAIVWSAFVRFEGRLADSFGKGRVWLAGDAGHTTGPAGIHSMNVGLREAADLADRIANILQGKAPVATLEDYATSRTKEWRRLLGLADDLRAGPATNPWITARRRRLTPCIPASGRDYERLAAQIGLQV